MMKAKLYLLFTFLWSIPASAQILGGEINYRCLGQNKYEAFVDLVASCSTTINTPTLYVQTPSTTFQADSVTLFGQFIEYNLTENCPGSDTCNPYKTIKYRYRGVFDLSSHSGCGFKLYIEEPTTNIATTYANRTSFCVYTELNRCADTCRQSPQLKTYGPTIYAYNQDLVASFSMDEGIQAGDSLVYTLTPALVSLSQPVTYSSNATSVRPLMFFGFPNHNLQWPAGFRLSPTDGTLLFRPTIKNQIGTVAVQITIYKEINGVQTVVTRKQIEKHFQILSSQLNQIPQILPPYSKQACVGVRTCMKIDTDDDDSTDILTVQFDGLLSSGMDIVVLDTSSPHPSYEICFTPDSSQISNIPYKFMAIAKDNACPMRGQSIRSFSFFVREPVKANPITQIDSCGKLTFQLPSPNNVQWASSSVQVKDSSTNTTTPFSFPTDSAYLETGTHHFQIKLRNSAGCVWDAYDTFRVQGPVYPNRISNSLLFHGCIDDSIQFGQMNPEVDVDYLWNDGNTDPSRYMTLGPDTTILFLKSSRSFCALNDTFRFKSDSLPNPSFSAGWQDSITFKGAINFPLSQVTYLWILNGSLYQSGPSISITGLPYDTVKLHVIATSSTCQSQDSSFVSPPLPNSLADITHPKLYPNPFSHSIFIDGKEIESVRMFNALGQEIAVRLEQGSGKTELKPLVDLPAGVYWLYLETEAGYYLEKVVKE